MDAAAWRRCLPMFIQVLPFHQSHATDILVTF